jgi:hypothetical protein
VPHSYGVNYAILKTAFADLSNTKLKNQDCKIRYFWKDIENAKFQSPSPFANGLAQV